VDILGKLGETIRSPQMQRAFETARAFYERAKLPSGAIWDKYDVGYPPVPYDASRWKAYGPNQLIGDNMLRGAMGFYRMGDVEAAKATLRFIKDQDGGVPAYLSLQTGEPAFVPGSRIYYDVVCTGMIRALALATGDTARAETCVAFLERTQDPETGAWYWGSRAQTFEPVEPRYATLTGLWAVTDLLRV
jgi:hypothetical protein